jgi:hypothetical protein
MTKRRTSPVRSARRHRGNPIAGKVHPHAPDVTSPDQPFDSDVEELTFAMHEYKRASGRMFPTWSEVLEVLTELGYRKRA